MGRRIKPKQTTKRILPWRYTQWHDFLSRKKKDQTKLPRSKKDQSKQLLFFLNLRSWIATAAAKKKHFPYQLLLLYSFLTPWLLDRYVSVSEIASSVFSLSLRSAFAFYTVVFLLFKEEVKQRWKLVERPETIKTATAKQTVKAKVNAFLIHYFSDFCFQFRFFFWIFSLWFWKNL